jgi:hypothetical protein
MGGLPPGDPEEYLEKSLGRVSVYIGVPLLGNLEEGSSTGDSESIKERRAYLRIEAPFGEPGGKHACRGL